MSQSRAAPAPPDDHHKTPPPRSRGLIPKHLVSQLSKKTTRPGNPLQSPGVRPDDIVTVTAAAMLLLPHPHHLCAAALAALALLPSGIGAGCPTSPDYTADEVIQKLNLTKNPEKGYFRETYADPDKVGTGGDSRAASTAIYYLLTHEDGQSVWHILDAPEIWHYYAGAPLELSLLSNDSTTKASCEKHTLGPAVLDGQAPQVVIPKDTWQSARSLGDWTLVGTTMTPGFSEKNAVLADDDHQPPVKCC
ncbi:Cupin family protein [Metarhizium album ARSEF 1941]|uniref:Cupin family protein n=1 Tax=Metarhizium album (strain ARSEF 1941) TaxID=1081103 RepID=A0A0B2X2G8_METAS|nr:Cupin family protein [Metarhizium album ARSEF 1941]KHO00469.1 Cupin family protein [Metarhizium album ARSEF 1941]